MSFFQNFLNRLTLFRDDPIKIWSPFSSIPISILYSMQCILYMHIMHVFNFIKIDINFFLLTIKVKGNFLKHPVKVKVCMQNQSQVINSCCRL